MIESSSAKLKPILIVAFHFPPAAGSSGHLRTLSFARELPKYGWRPIVLTVSPYVHPETNQNNIGLPSSVRVYRAFAVDTARHLAIRGRYFRRMALPDRWASWMLMGVPLGLTLIARYRPKILWTTYPIATAHLLGIALHRLTGIPWVADFRDPMIEIDPYTGERTPAEPDLWNARSWIESHVMGSASRNVFVSSGALEICAERYPHVSRQSMALIPNGYDEDGFVQAEAASSSYGRAGRIVLLHSGLLYPTPDRDPKDFFTALAALKKSKTISSDNLQVVLRASGYDERYRRQVSELGIQDIVHLAPLIPYVDALAEMLFADGLLLFQGYTSNPAIPAKLYEYFRARRPIFAMVHKDGDTAAVLRAEGVGRIVPLSSPQEIAAGLQVFLAEVGAKRAPVLSKEAVAKHSRAARAAALAALLEEITH